MHGLPQILVITGVAGSGKTTVARELATRTGAVPLDADDFHTAASIAKMAVGEPLADEDREPWIDALVAELGHRAARGERVVLACSALRRRHRLRLATAADDVVLVHLDVDPAELRRRLEERSGHFASADLLDSQLADLEPSDGEVVIIDGDRAVHHVVDEALRRIGG